GLMHLNDSKAPLGSRRDRHELIAEGTIGERAFRRIMTDERLVAIPKVIETPKLDDAETTDRRMLERLASYAGGRHPERPSVAREPTALRASSRKRRGSLESPARPARSG